MAGLPSAPEQRDLEDGRVGEGGTARFQERVGRGRATTGGEPFLGSRGRRLQSACQDGRCLCPGAGSAVVAPGPMARLPRLISQGGLLGLQRPRPHARTHGPIVTHRHEGDPKPDSQGTIRAHEGLGLRRSSATTPLRTCARCPQAPAPPRRDAGQALTSPTRLVATHHAEIHVRSRRVTMGGGTVEPSAAPRAARFDWTRGAHEDHDPRVTRQRKPPDAHRTLRGRSRLASVPIEKRRSRIRSDRIGPPRGVSRSLSITWTSRFTWGR